MKEKNSVTVKDKTTVVKSENGDDLSKNLFKPLLKNSSK